MKRLRGKVLASVLTLSMVFQTMPTIVFASEIDGISPDDTIEVVVDENFKEEIEIENEIFEEETEKNEIDVESTEIEDPENPSEEIVDDESSEEVDEIQSEQSPEKVVAVANSDEFFAVTYATTTTMGLSITYGNITIETGKYSYKNSDGNSVTTEPGGTTMPAFQISGSSDSNQLVVESGTHTITLKDVAIGTDDSINIYEGSEVDLILSGNNTLNKIVNNGTLTINGGGTLIINEITVNGATYESGIISFDSGVNYTVYGDTTLTSDFTLPSGSSIHFDDGATLTIDEDVTLTNNGTINGDITNNGTLENNSEITGNVTNSGTIYNSGEISGDVDGGTLKELLTESTISAKAYYIGDSSQPNIILTYTGGEEDAIMDASVDYTLEITSSTYAVGETVEFSISNSEDSDAYYMESDIDLSATILQSGMDFDDADGETTLKAYDKDNTETDTFTYGDTITICVTPSATGSAVATVSSITFEDPTTNEMALFVGETQITEAKTVTSGEELTFSIATTDGFLTSGTTNTIAAKYTESTSMAEYEESINITLNKAELTPSFTVSNKTYDGTNTATVSSIEFANYQDDTDFTVDEDYTVSAVFSDSAMDTGKTVTATVTLLSTALANNYTLSTTAPTTTADITAVELTVTYTGDDLTKTYDGISTYDSEIALTLSGLMTVDASGTLKVSGGTFDATDVASASKVTLSVDNLIATGFDLDNYSFTLPEITASITKKSLSVTYTGSDLTKEYDDTAAYDEDIDLTMSGLIDSESIGYLVAAGGTFNSSDVASASKVTLSASDLTETDFDLANYSYTLPEITATITAKDAEVLWSVDSSYTYTGNELTIPTATITGEGDDGSISLSVSEDNKKTFQNADTYDFTATTDNQNYTLSENTQEVTIEKAEITIEVEVEQSATYSGEDLYPSVPVATTVDETSATILYGTTSGTYDLEEMPSYTNVDDYVVYYEITADNHTTETGSIAFSITTAASDIESSMVVKNGDTTTSSFVYGDTITVTFSPKVVTEASRQSVTLMSVDLNTAQLLYGEKVLATAALVDDSYTLIYDTCDGDLTIGTNKLTVEYGGSSNLDASTTTTDIQLDAKEVDVLWVIDDSYTFTGEELTEPTASFVGVGEEGDIALSVAEDDETVFQNAGEYNFTATTTNTNYTLVGDTKEITVAKAEEQTLQDVTLDQKYSVITAQSQSVASVGMPENAGGLSYAVGTPEVAGTGISVDDFAVSDSGVVTFTLSGGTVLDVDQTIILPITITSVNYKDSVVNIEITILDKEYQTELVFTNDNYVLIGESLPLAVTEGAETDSSIVYTIEEGTVATITESTLQASDEVGMVKITATKAGDVDYYDTSVSMMVFVLEGADSIPETTTNGASISGTQDGNSITEENDFEIMFNSSVSDSEATTLGEALPSGYTEEEMFHLYALYNSLIVDEATFSTQISITVSYPVLSGRTYKVLHLLQSGEVEEISTTTNVTNQTLTFSVDEMSPFLVVSKANASSDSYYIKVTTDGNGTVDPDGGADSMYKVEKWDDVTFEFDADSGYEVSDVIVNGSSVGAMDEYTFADIIIKMQTLEVVFAKKSDSSSDDEVSEEDEDEDNACELPFVDIDEDDEQYDGIAYVYENGIMAGMTSEEFGANYSITRAMIAAILYRMDGSESVECEMPFADVLPEKYYYEAVRWGKDAGVMAGISDTEFAPNTAITNEQFVAFLYRYATYLGMDTTVSEDANLSEYMDADAVREYAYSAMLWAVEKEILGETENLNARTEASRGDVAVALMNFLEIQ